MSTNNISTDEMVNKIANYFIWFYHDHGDFISNLKLQKLLYFAQGWHLGLYGKPLFNNQIEAWIHGPVIPNIYSRFKKYSYNPISETVDKPQLSDETVQYLNELLKVYAPYQAFELELMSHKTDAWIEARGGIPIDEPCNNIISHESMKKYFGKMASENE